MDAIFKFKTYSLNKFLYFCRHILRVWLKSLTSIFIYLSKKVSKYAEFHADFKSVESFKKCTKKVISKTTLTNMRKSGKNAHFCQITSNLGTNTTQQ